MKTARIAAWIVLGVVAAASLSAGWIAPASYERQFRDFPNAAPSARFPLGTDELGRDRFSRLLYGARISLLLAPAAALLATALAGLIGCLAGFFGGWLDRLGMAGVDLVLSLPWLFLLLAVRALLPLNVSPLVSVLLTFALLGLLGWAAPARVVRAGVRSVLTSDFVLQGRACGLPRRRLLFAHILPAMKPVLIAQFWISIPLFILSEATLGLLGLGVAEPLPSLGNLLRGLENYTALPHNPAMAAPAVLLVAVTACLQFVVPSEEFGL